MRRARDGVRLVSAKVGITPDPAFLVIGTQKGGTSSLYEYLSWHPGLREARRKEVHFFDRHYARGWTWYKSQFPVSAARPGLLTGEATPYYLFHPDIPRRVSQSLPEAKFVVLLRNPVDRAYSHYRHTLRHGFDIPTFEEALELEQRLFAERGADPGWYDDEACHRHSYLHRGRYDEQLRRWFEYFPRERFLVLKSEDLYREPEVHYAAALDFLGLAPWRPTGFPAYNPGGYTDQQMRPETLASLREHFRPDNARLSRLLDMDVSEWDA